MDRVSTASMFPGVIQAREQMWMAWQQVKAPVLVPLLQLAVYICLTMSVMLFVEKVYMAVVITTVRLLGRRPETRYKWEPMGDDAELGTSAYPMVLIQIPMYNEKEVYQLSIGAACGLSWPSDRIIIQVLDDSTDDSIKELVQIECRKWANKGVNIKYAIRDDRVGYKAGALRQGLKHSYVKECEYVVIFDADFQPEPNFLLRTIPFLIHNPKVALVQGRWTFVNADENMMTRMQEMSLDYHFFVEQQVGSSTYGFFGFNGTAGVWRISAVNEAGGWKDRTTVEDMDLSVRASLKGWKYIFLKDLEVKSELPSTFKAFRHQQHRWACGPANLFRKMVMEICKNKVSYLSTLQLKKHLISLDFDQNPLSIQKVTLWTKIYVIYSFFFIRKIVGHIVTFIFYCIVIPMTVFVPEVQIPKWGLVYIPSVITLLNSVGTPRSFHLLMFWVLFENVMSLHRTKATLSGLLEAGGRVNEWVVTEKLGDIMKTKSKAARKPRLRIGDRLHLMELCTGVYLFFCGCYDLAHGKNHYYIYLYLQAIAFVIVGFGYVGTFVPQS
ncbi:putative glucomannan 4-beta-mannosyltransferase 9 isoform X1 [Curcuma longa]|uniref:putative glucomannan 4-beta-mannosyltransferase 9 isoform X1 n=1 Tax=Curcuma longa TaxID=136217 RepID=UPI003D9DD5D5